ncbi:MAG: NmrA family NAD(P)-binding protein [Pseudomonadota bacterium]
MQLPKILVTGAAGRTGAVVITELLRAGYPVRALVRRQDERSAALQARGVEVAVGEMTDVKAVAAAMQGVQRAYWLPPSDPAMLTGAAVFVVAARQAKLESLVVLSQWLASPSHPALLTRQHWLADQIFAALPGISVTRVTPGFFADAPYLAPIGLAAHLGLFPWMFGDTLSAPPSVEDIGRVCAAALMDPERHAGQTYHPTGPALLSGEDMAAILGRVFARRVRAIPTPLPIYLRAVYLDGNPLVLLGSMGHYIEEHRRGAFALDAPNDHVQRVTGRMAESFETVARRLAVLPANRRSTANTVREFARFMLIPFVPMPSLARYMRALQVSAPAQPEYVAESAVWRAEHGLAPISAPGVANDFAPLILSAK